MWAVTLFENCADQLERDREPERLARLARLVEKKAGAVARAVQA
jgi:hypothetical protein